MRKASPSQKVQLRQKLELAGIVELGERGTRRLSPWRRALASEALGEIGAERSVPCLLARLEDRRPEVRLAAVRALGDIGSQERPSPRSQRHSSSAVSPRRTSSVVHCVGSVARPRPPSSWASFRTTRSSVSRRVLGSRGLPRSAVSLWSAWQRCLLQIPIPRCGRQPRPRSGSWAVRERRVSWSTRLTIRMFTCAGPLCGRLASFDDPATGDLLVEHAEDEGRNPCRGIASRARRPRAAAAGRTHLESSPGWAVEYARKVAEVTA